MQEASKYFEGEHDFKAFKSSGTSSKSSVRIIYKAVVIKKENNMVRIISGTLIEVGLRKN